MKLRIFLLALLSVISCSIIILTFTFPIKYHLNSFIYSDLPVDSTDIPAKNKAILQYAAKNGRTISPSYQKAVCTEYLISVVNKFCPLDNQQKNKIRIVTNEPIETLLTKNSPVPKGVYYALTSCNKGIAIDNIKNAKPGDLVQFWNNRDNKPIGHCGILRAIALDKGLISLYSSSPRTNGHGKQIYILPKHLYIVRLK